MQWATKNREGGGDRNWRAFPFPCDKLWNAKLDYKISLKSLCPETLQWAVLQLFQWCLLWASGPSKDSSSPSFLLLTSSPWAQIQCCVPHATAKENFSQQGWERGKRWETGAEFPKVASAPINSCHTSEHLSGYIWCPPRKKSSWQLGEEPFGEGRFVTIYWQVVENNLQGQVFPGTGKFGAFC